MEIFNQIKKLKLAPDGNRLAYKLLLGNGFDNLTAHWLAFDSLDIYSIEQPILCGWTMCVNEINKIISTNESNHNIKFKPNTDIIGIELNGFIFISYVTNDDEYRSDVSGFYCIGGGQLKNRFSPLSVEVVDKRTNDTCGEYVYARANDTQIEIAASVVDNFDDWYPYGCVSLHVENLNIALNNKDD